MDILFSLLQSIIILYIGFIIGKFFMFRKMFIEHSTPEISTVDIIITKHDDLYLVHGRHTNEFITQGKTKEDLLETLALRYPLTKFMMSDENVKELGFK